MKHHRNNTIIQLNLNSVRNIFFFFLKKLVLFLSKSLGTLYRKRAKKFSRWKQLMRSMKHRYNDGTILRCHCFRASIVKHSNSIEDLTVPRSIIIAGSWPR